MDDRHSWAETSDAPTQRQRTGWGAAAQGVQILPRLLTRAVILGRKSPEHWFPHFRTGNTNANDGLVCGSNYINNIKIPAQNEMLAVTARSLHSDQPHARWRPGSRWARRRAHGPAGCLAQLPSGERRAASVYQQRRDHGLHRMELNTRWGPFRAML